MAANLIARYIWEVNTLAKTRHGLSLDELNEQWQDSYLYDGKEIVRKTWWEHRNQISLQFGVNMNQYSVIFYAASASKLNISLILSLFKGVFGFFSNTSIIRCT